MFYFLDSSIRAINAGETIAIDGKTKRGTTDKSMEKSAIHMDSAWAGDNKLVLLQVKKRVMKLQRYQNSWSY